MATQIKCPVLKSPKIVTIFLLHWGFIALGATSLTDNSNPYRHVKTIDPKGKYVLEWLVDWKESRVIFNTTVQTKGYIGFGISKKGKMIGADIVMGGVTPDGRPYFSDRHAPSNEPPVKDASQDWTLHAAWENRTHTFLSFSRPFETCDEENDIIINKDCVALIWAYGERDNDREYHYQHRGVHDAYLLDPDLAPHGIVANQPSNDVINPENVQIWRINGTQLMPARDTTYMCSIHKAPGGLKKHIIGYNSLLETEAERRFIHHFLFHRCHAPEGQDAGTIFEPLLGHKEECYILRQPAGRIPTQYCTELYHVWAVGQLPNFFPEHVGLPISESRNEYYLLQMHFNNPEAIPGLQLNYALEVFHTEKLRKHDAGMLAVGELTPGSPDIMMPPHSLAHRIYGQCGSGCSAKIIPEEGIRVFAVELHTHLAGRGIRLLQIRNNQELPWILYDDNYNFNFQQVRTLTEERVVLPEDLLVYRCVYSNTDRNGNVTIGGFSSNQEMCNGFIYYYNRNPTHGVCRSELRSNVYRQFLGIHNTTWSNERIEMVVTSPPENAGLTVSQVGNYRMNWTIENRKLIQHYHRYLPQITQCPPFVTPATTMTPNIAGNNVTPGARGPAQRTIDASRNAGLGLSNSGLSSLSSTDIEGEIRDPENEFVTIYPSDIVPYELPSICRKSSRPNTPVAT